MQTLSTAKLFFLLSATALSSFPPPALGQWAPGGIPVPGSQWGYGPTICSDGSGGAIIGWGVASEDVPAQHITSSGSLAQGWPAAGLGICTDPAQQALVSVIPDGLGGAIFGWYDYRSGPYKSLFAQRISSTGQPALGWAVNGNPVTLGPVGYGPSMVADGSAGAFFVWSDGRTGSGIIYAQHLTAQGAIASGWPADGVPVSSLAGVASFAVAVSDGAGGLLMGWYDLAADGTFMQHLTAAGAIYTGWPPGGIRISSPGRYFYGMVSDDSGGAYIGLRFTTLMYPLNERVFLVRITGEGEVAPGWTPGGTALCDSSSSEFRDNLVVAADGQGGVYGAWRITGPYTTIRAVRMRADGTFAPNWPLNGIQISTLSGYQNVGGSLANGSTPMLDDGAGGVYFAFDVDTDIDRTYIQHFAGGGIPAPGWTDAGTALSPDDSQGSATLASDGAGGVIVAWENRTARYIYVQHVAMDGVVATDLAPVSADAQPGRVLLLWQGDVAASVIAVVERRAASSAWVQLGAPSLEGRDRLRFEDRNVAPGSRYGYRLTYTQGAIARQTTETWVDVPQQFELALTGARPNPSAGRLNVAFSLRDDSPASLAMLDVAGREVMHREVNSLGPGRHVVPVDPETRLAPGLYWLKLSQGGRSLLARAVVIR